MEDFKVVIIFGLVLHAAEDLFRTNRDKSYKNNAWGEASLMRRLQALMKQVVDVLIRCAPLLYYSIILYDHF